MKTFAHSMAGILAFTMIACFWISTFVSELFLSFEAVELVKHGILISMWILIPTLIITGASGFLFVEIPFFFTPICQGSFEVGVCSGIPIGSHFNDVFQVADWLVFCNIDDGSGYA